jgi:WD40 repeat protein
LDQRDSGVGDLAYGPDGKVLATVNGCVIELWDVVNEKHIGTLRGHSCEQMAYAYETPFPHGGTYDPVVVFLAFRPYGKVLASGSQDRTIKL